MSLRDLGLSDIGVSQLDELVCRLLPPPGPEAPLAVPSIWRTSHVSTDSFFHNKHGEKAVELQGFGLTILLFNKTNFHFLSPRGFTQELGGVWITNIPQTIPQSSKRSLLTATILAW